VEAVAAHPKPIRLLIPGAFWDSQIYSGTLYLFGLSGELRTISWDRLVADLAIPETLRIAGDLALLGNHCLYENGARLLLSDPDISDLLLEKFRRLGSLPPWEVSLSEADLEDNPLPFPHNDSAVHYHTLYVGASDGLYKLAAGDRGGSRGRIHLSDAPALHIAAGLSTMAQAAGTDGLFATRLASEAHSSNGHAATTQDIHVSELSCMTCEWAYSSVIAAGHDHSIYLAPFVQSPDRARGGSRSRQRQFDSVIAEPEIFTGTRRRIGDSPGALAIKFSGLTMDGSRLLSIGSVQKNRQPSLSGVIYHLIIPRGDPRSFRRGPHPSEV
jgi:hypothetical protein